MIRLLRSPWVAECASAVLVFFTAAIVGREAAAGMNDSQWISAAVAVLCSIGVAVMVHVGPAERPGLSAFQKTRRD